MKVCILKLNIVIGPYIRLIQTLGRIYFGKQLKSCWQTCQMYMFPFIYRDIFHSATVNGHISKVQRLEILMKECISFLFSLLEGRSILKFLYRSHFPPIKLGTQKSNRCDINNYFLLTTLVI